MIGNEGAIPSGLAQSTYIPRSGVRRHNKDDIKFMPVDDVQWITTLRHPFSRTLSHYHHVLRNKAHQNLSLQEFLTRQCGAFHCFIDNQQTRWHCGSGKCVSNKNLVTQDYLQQAIDNLERMDAVLILEDMSNPHSCTRRQMRSVLNFTEVFREKAMKAKGDRHSDKTNWADAVKPFLNRWGVNETIRGFEINNSNAYDVSSTNDTESLLSMPAMAAMGLHNEMDMHLYGYARHLCESLADRYDMEEAKKEFWAEELQPQYMEESHLRQSASLQDSPAFTSMDHDREQFINESLVVAETIMAGNSAGVFQALLTACFFLAFMTISTANRRKFLGRQRAPRNRL